MSKETPADRAISKLLVAKGTLHGVRECLIDLGKRKTVKAIKAELAAAIVFVQRGLGKLDDARAEIAQAFIEAELPMTRTRRRGPPRMKAHPGPGARACLRRR